MLEDLRSLCRAAQAYEEQHEHATLTGLLEHAAGLHAQEVDAATDRRITVSTIHRAKGTEAQLVALLACEEQLLPSWRSLSSPDPERLAEERRLFYVAATRARKLLVVTASGGDEQDKRPSRFLAELAGDDIEIERASAATRWLSLPALVADLRRTAADPGKPAALRRAAARQYLCICGAESKAQWCSENLCAIEVAVVVLATSMMTVVLANFERGRASFHPVVARITLIRGLTIVHAGKRNALAVS